MKIKNILSLMGLICIFNTSFATESQKYIIEESKDRLVFIDNKINPNTGNVAFVYYESLPEFKDYLFISVMEADCNNKNKLKLSNLSAINIKHGISKETTDLTENEKNWRVYMDKSPEGLTWTAICKKHSKNLNQIRNGNVFEIVQDYQNFIHNKPVIIR